MYRGAFTTLFLFGLCPAGWSREPVAVVATTTEIGKNGQVKIKIEITDPKPISGGELRLTSATRFTNGVSGVNVFSGNGDAVGVALPRGNHLQVNFASLSASSGGGNHPIVAITLNPGAGQTAPDIDVPGTRLLDPSGLPYDKTIDRRTRTAEMAIGGVTPASGFVPAGGILVIRGVGFEQGAAVELEGVELASVIVRSPAEIEVTADQGFRIDGRRLRVKNPNGSLDVFFAYAQGAVVGTSTSRLLASAIPIFPKLARTTGLFPAVLAGSFDGTRWVTGLAFQNLNSSEAQVSVEVFSPGGQRTGKGTLTVPAGSQLWREIREVARELEPQRGGFITVKSTKAVQMAGLVGDEDRDLLAPLAARGEAQVEDVGDDKGGLQLRLPGLDLPGQNEIEPGRGREPEPGDDRGGIEPGDDRGRNGGSGSSNSGSGSSGSDGSGSGSGETEDGSHGGHSGKGGGS